MGRGCLDTEMPLSGIHHRLITQLGNRADRRVRGSQSTLDLNYLKREIYEENWIPEQGLPKGKGVPESQGQNASLNTGHLYSITSGTSGRTCDRWHAPQIPPGTQHCAAEQEQHRRKPTQEKKEFHYHEPNFRFL